MSLPCQIIAHESRFFYKPLTLTSKSSVGRNKLLVIHLLSMRIGMQMSLYLGMQTAHGCYGIHSLHIIVTHVTVLHVLTLMVTACYFFAMAGWCQVPVQGKIAPTLHGGQEGMLQHYSRCATRYLEASFPPVNFAENWRCIHTGQVLQTWRCIRTGQALKTGGASTPAKR